MFDQFRQIWRQNNGNLLLMMGGIVIAIGSVVWYFNVLPDVRLVVPNNLALQLPASSNRPTEELIVLIRGPARSPSMLRGIQGMVMLLPPAGELTEFPQPLQTLPFEMDARGMAGVTLNGTGRPEVAIAAFLDLNSNGILDIDAAGLPTEPVRLSSFPMEEPRTLSLSVSPIVPESGSPTIVELDFTSE